MRVTKLEKIGSLTIATVESTREDDVEKEPKLRPIGDHIVVRVDKAPDKIGGIILPDSGKQRPQRGEVLAVGPGRLHPEKEDKFIPMQIEVGDVVLFAKWGGHEIKEIGEDLFIMSEHDILAVVEK